MMVKYNIWRYTKESKEEINHILLRVTLSRTEDDINLQNSDISQEKSKRHGHQMLF